MMFSYFGSKARVAPTYQAPRHDVIVEPFAGAAGYSMYWLTRRSDLRAVLIDVDPLVVEMWNTLLALSPEDLWDYPLPKAGDRTTDLIPLACMVSSGSWARRARGSDYQITERMARDIPHRRRIMASALRAVRGRVSIVQGDYTESPDIEATWFIDPPYQREGIYYASGNALDFAALGEWSRTRRGQAIVCETVGADWMDFQPHVTNQTVTNAASVEAVWCSHPEPNLFTEIA